MKPYSPSDKLVVRDSLIDEELSDDVEDDVFIRDGRNCTTYEDKNLKRPLMAPRKKFSKKSTKNSIQLLLNRPNYKKSRCWRCCEPFCYGLAAIVVLIAMICLTALLLTLFPISLQKFKLWFHNYNNNSIFYNSLLNSNSDIFVDKATNLEMVPCTQMQVTRVWSLTLGSLNSETPLRKADLNGDSIEDIIVGYGVDDSMDLKNIPQCSSSKLGITDVCGGGILAINGLTGRMLWQFWTIYTVFSVFCKTDLNKDGFIDCVAGGRGGLLIAVNGRTGQLLWEVQEASMYSRYSTDDGSNVLIDLYTVNIVSDLDDDQVNDIVAVHTDEKENIKEGHIKLISGNSGKIIKSISTPNNEEIFVQAQLMVQNDGTRFLLVLTGGQNSPGGVYKILLSSINPYKTVNDFIPIIRNNASGFLVPAVLTDINGDGIDDIIVAAFNSTVYAFNGKTDQIIWKYVFPSSETVSSIVPGHFDSDNVTDFMIKYNTGPGFPVYYYSETTILNGVNGQSLLDSKITDSGGSHSLLGGVSISQSYGGDFFLHWQLQCRDKIDAKDPYTFIPDSDIIQQSRADLCMLRYNTSTILKLNAVSRHIAPPGPLLFSSDDLQLQLNQADAKNPNKPTVQQPLKHPKMRLDKQQQQQQQQQKVQQQQPAQQSQVVQQQAQQPQQPIEVNKKQSNPEPFQEIRPVSQNVQQQNPQPQYYPQGKLQQLPAQSNQYQKQSSQIQKLKSNLQQELNGSQQSNKNAIVMNKKIEVNDRNLPVQTPTNIKKPVKQKMLFQQREKQLSDNLESRREKILSHVPRKNPGNYESPNSEDLSNMLDINKMEILDDLQEIQNAQDGNEFLRMGDNELRNLQPEEKTNDYDMYYNDDQISPGRFLQQMRPPYQPSNREIRSDDYDLAPSTYETILNDLEKSVQTENSKSQSVKRVLDDSDVKATEPIMEVRPETLWDIEIEKEAKENQQLKQGNKGARKRDVNEKPLNQNVLPTIASTGVLVDYIKESANSTEKSAIDLVFLLNLRESETFPPLLLAADIDCIEERMNVARSYRPENELFMLQRKYLKECLKNRLANIPIDSMQSKPAYETQIVITRISIVCKCSDDLNPQREKCSTLNSANQQKWTEFMGTNLNGIY